MKQSWSNGRLPERTEDISKKEDFSTSGHSEIGGLGDA